VTPNELLLAAGAGDRVAFTELVERLAEPTRVIVKGFLKDQHQIDEVTRAVIREAWETAPAFDPADMSANQWLLALARRRASQRARRGRRVPAELVVRSLRRDGNLEGSGPPSGQHGDRLLWELGSLFTGDGDDVRHDVDLDPVGLTGVSSEDRSGGGVVLTLRRLRASVAKLVA
jgi:DNA-directed RNA polymerase specialized sigma24 family protein